MKEQITKNNIPDYTGITCDSREVKPGFAFVAIKGFNRDGHDYINEAIEKGASVVFTEKEPVAKTNRNIPIIKVQNSRTVFAQLAADFYEYPSEGLELIGVTGTNGKTTTTHLIYHLLNHNHKKEKKAAGLIGTVKVDTGQEIIPGKLTTPAPITLQKYLQEMLKNNLKYVCMEVSSHGIKLDRIAGCKFSVKVGTNISIDHFDLHPNFPEYINIKKGFLQENKSKLILINQDDPYLKSPDILTKNLLNYGIDSKANIRAENIEKWNNGTLFNYRLCKPIKMDNGNLLSPLRFPIKMHLPGKHNIYNSLVAISIALFYGLKPTLIQDFFANFMGIWRRLQFIYKKDFIILDDCAHNPGSYQAVFNAVTKLKYNKVYIVNSLRGNRGVKINKKNAEVISQWLPRLGDYSLFTSNCNEVVKEIDRVSQDEEEIFLKILNKNKIRYYHYNNLTPVLKDVISQVNRGDLILLLGPHAMDQAGKMILKIIKN
ncbi:UDP-N-acetylmuramyl-tripeptide synthetase [Halocella sp. SP3-1]|uniref:Mur ligase family protein n=1 Tax=Halocella sp. SP3-1 TaxID=2382161 RepID=UPI000F74EF62|nr:UDP-N-acetylmuramyl-tripeptide synthetase [Halocella sp. SP3-1]AZO93115.1 UDP-N-acetylmuramyl-tripeptide synthetase [Halocella sp. SP3-1]